VNEPDKKIADLHMHSNASDGIFSPSELMKIAAEAGLSAAALTDHDTVTGLPDAAASADKYGIEFVPGVEISIIEAERETHLLGYYPKDIKLLAEELVSLQQARYNRMDIIIGKLKGLGFNISKKDLEAETGGAAAPGRLHAARVMLKKKYVQSLNQAFSLYLNKNRPAYFPRRTLSMDQTMELIKEAGAIPVVAHPGVNIKVDLERLIALGLKGIEVYHPDHSKALTRSLRDLAMKRGLIITGGSDYHGVSRENPAFPVHRSIPYSYFEKMKELACQ
jgi:3',5'-nucleoside bisphosphate phosphatase